MPRSANVLLLLAIRTLLAVPHASPPDPPLNLLPPDGAVDVEANPQLCATLRDPQASALDVRFFGRDVGAAPVDDFTVIALPDSQYYLQTFPEIYAAQIR